MPRRRRRRGTVLTGLLVAAVAGGAVVLTHEPTELTRRVGWMPLPPEPEVAEAIHADVTAVAADVEAWWAEQLTTRGYAPVALGGRISPGGGRLTCDAEPIERDSELVENAWAGTCAEGLTIAYDPGLFVDDPVGLRVTVAHEFGHLVQFAHRALDVGVMDKRSVPAEAELQADCFAGAWVADRPAVDLDLARLDMERSGDPPDVPEDDPDGHGSPQERVAAFDAGHGGGVDACLPGVFDPRPAP